MSGDLDAIRKYPTFILYFRRYAPFDSFGGGIPLSRFARFEGDHRTGPSTSPKATSRTYGVVFFNQSGVVYQFAGSSGSEVHPAFSGVIRGMAKVSMTVVRTTLAGPLLFGFTANTAGSMPLIPGAPDINTFISAQVDFGHPKWLRIWGEAFGDNFPNLEIFVSSGQHSALLLDGRTTGGRDTGPAMRLMGSHSNHSLGKFVANLALNEKGELAFDHTSPATTLSPYDPIAELGAFNKLLRPSPQ